MGPRFGVPDWNGDLLEIVLQLTLAVRARPRGDRGLGHLACGGVTHCHTKSESRVGIISCKISLCRVAVVVHSMANSVN